MINHIKQENHEYKRIRFQILAQAPTNETNKELWLKRQEYLWICWLGTLSKLSNKGLNKLIIIWPHISFQYRPLKNNKF